MEPIPTPKGVTQRGRLASLYINIVVLANLDFHLLSLARHPVPILYADDASIL